MTSVRTERTERWVRAWVGDVAVVDSRRPILFWPDEFPVPGYAVDREDVRTDLLRPNSSPGPREPFFFQPKGPVAHWYDVVVAGRELPHAAWQLDDPDLGDALVLSWQPGLIDRWTEEEQTVRSHPRDPYKRVDALPSSRHVQVSVGGLLLADSHDPVLLFETGLPTRFYLPRADVRWGALQPGDNESHCPYKGVAREYWDLPAGAHGDRIEGIAWSYDDPDPAVGAIRDRIAFYDELVDVRLDGVDRPRAVSEFSNEENRPRTA